MWRDVGLGEWLFEIDEAQVSEIAERLLALHRDKERTAAFVAKTRAFTQERGAAMMTATERMLDAVG